MPTTMRNRSNHMLEPLGDMECNVSSSFFSTHFAFSEDFAPFSILFVDCISAIECAFLHQDAVLTPADGTREGGGQYLQGVLTHHLFRRFSHVLHPSLSSRWCRKASPSVQTPRSASRRSYLAPRNHLVKLCAEALGVDTVRHLDHQFDKRLSGDWELVSAICNGVEEGLARPWVLCIHYIS